MAQRSPAARLLTSRVDTNGSAILRHRGPTYDPSLPAVVQCHGWGETLDTYLADWRLNALLRAGWTVYTAYTGLNWGTLDPNPDDATGRQAVADAITRAATDGHDGPVMLYGTSMGACNVLNHAWRNPDDVAALYGLVPVYDIPSVWGSDPLLTLSLAGTFATDQAGLPAASADVDPAQNIGDLAGIPCAFHAVEDDEIIDFAGLVDFADTLDAPLTTSPTGGHAGAWSGTFDEYDALRWFVQHT